MRVFSRLLFVVSCAVVHALTAHAAQWSRTYGPGQTAFVQAVADGGFVVAGFDGPGGWVLKLDNAGNGVWKHLFSEYEHPGESEGVASVQPTSDGGYVVFGHTFHFSIWRPTISPRLIRLDAQGNALWTKSYTDLGWIVSAHPSHDGGWVTAGSAYAQGAGRENTDARILKFDADGELVWAATFGDQKRQEAHGVYPIDDGGYLVAGSTESSTGGGLDTWVARLTAGGQMVWQKTYAEPDRLFGIRHMQQTADNGFVVVGAAWSSTVGGAADVWVAKLDPAGSVLWQRTYGGPSYDSVTSALPRRNGAGVVIAGTTSSFGAGGTDGWIFAIDADGEVLWQRTFGGTGDDSVQSIQPAADGGYIVAGNSGSFGSSGSQVWILKLNATGAIDSCPLMGLSLIAVAEGRVVASDSILAGRTFTPVPSVYVGPVGRGTVAPSSQQCFDALPASRHTAVEYRHSAFGHYFLTTGPDEIAALDAGALPGWARTGLSFPVYGLDPGAASVCRFWSGQTFLPKSSHFYTPYASECAKVKQQGVWQYEGDVFGLVLPFGFPGQGTCRLPTRPLYRAYNNGMSGAPNHRYTTDPAVLDAMIAQGWVMEGEAVTRVFACVPGSP
jgi:hypothetical protein